MAVVYPVGGNRWENLWRHTRPVLAAVQNLANVFTVLILWGTLFVANPDIPTAFMWATFPVVLSLIVTVVYLVRTVLRRRNLPQRNYNRRMYSGTLALALEVGVLLMLYGLNAYLGLSAVLVLWIVRLASLGIAGADIYSTSKLLS